jgi:hypothetical protein
MNDKQAVTAETKGNASDFAFCFDQFGVGDVYVAPIVIKELKAVNLFGLEWHFQVAIAGVGAGLALHWPSTGPPLALHWPFTGPSLALHWPSTGPSLARHWPVTGPSLARHWHVCRDATRSTTMVPLPSDKKPQAQPTCCQRPVAPGCISNANTNT